MLSELLSEYFFDAAVLFLTAPSLFSLPFFYLQPTFFDATGVVTFGKGVVGAIRLVIKATETKQAALVVGNPLIQNVPATILIEGGEYVSNNYSGMMIGLDAAVTMCGGEFYGGNSEGTAYPGVALVWGGTLNMAGGHIVGGSQSDEFDAYLGAGLVLYPDAALDTSPTATITGGTITGGSFLYEDGNYSNISIFAGNMTKVHLAGGKLSGDLYFEPEATVVVYGETYLSYENGMLNGKLCDGSELGGISVYGGGNVELKGCGDAPKIEECGKKSDATSNDSIPPTSGKTGKKGKGDAVHRTRQKASKAK
jgi:hypothetical protein